MRVPPGESEQRNVCSECDYVDYYNPKLVSLSSQPADVETQLVALLMPASKTHVLESGRVG